MATLLLLIIYLIFISLGLPDSLVASSWPAISQSLGIGADFQGILTFVVSFCTIISSFLTVKLVKLLTAKGVVLISILLTAIGLLCISFSPNFVLIVLSAIPLGLGAGAIDSTLNNYVAVNYKAIHLNWLHAFWGVGASVSPLICGAFLTDINGWRNGALCLAIIQTVIWLICLISIKVWKKAELEFESRDKKDNQEENKINTSLLKTFKLRGVIPALIGFFCYIAIEQTTANWFSSMVVFNMGVAENTAANWAALFYIGIMVGRLLSGVVSLKINDKNLIRIGEGIILLGLILMCMQFNVYLMPVALVLVGFGCAPIYPAIIHSTPTRFTVEHSQSVMSIQMGFAYIANVTFAPLFGVVGKNTSFLILPYVIMGVLVLSVVSNELVNKLTKPNQKEEIAK